MKPTIKAKDILHLRELIDSEINKNGNECDLNHIVVTKIKSFRGLFKDSKFNGNINHWDVSNVKDMDYMFENSSFIGDLSNWKPYKAHFPGLAFYYSKAPLPYWAAYNDPEIRKKIIDTYQLQKELSEELNENSHLGKKVKI